MDAFLMTILFNTQTLKFGIAKTSRAWYNNFRSAGETDGRRVLRSPDRCILALRKPEEQGRHEGLNRLAVMSIPLCSTRRHRNGIGVIPDGPGNYMGH
jgi:hypothetical protein